MTDTRRSNWAEDQLLGKYGSGKRQRKLSVGGRAHQCREHAYSKYITAGSYDLTRNDKKRLGQDAEESTIS